MDQSKTPLVAALQHCATRPNAAFHTPGHKRGQSITPRLRQLFGTAAFQADLPELPELDNLFAPEDVILSAQQLAAKAFGAQKTRFLANGSTCGIEAAILATCGPGDKIVVPRNAHISVISGLILTGAVPVYVAPYDAKGQAQRWNVPSVLEPAQIANALETHPDSKAVLLVSPTYEGLCSRVDAITNIVHKYNIPLIVDEAHGPHFAFHPGLPATALASGADIVVQSAHKVLSAFTQAALLHTQGDRIDQNRLAQALQITQSSSPSYLLLGSLDAARHQMATQGEALLARTIEFAHRAERALNQLPRLKVLRPNAQHSICYGDCTRLTVDVLDLGLTGFEADQILHSQQAVTAELPTLDHLTFIISIGNTKTDIDQLIHGLTNLCESRVLARHTRKRTQGLASTTAMPPNAVSSSCLSPRQAFFGVKRPLPLAQAIGQVCAETLSPYPPGIPVILPGEVITADAIASLQTTLEAGGILTGNSDPTLQTILTVAKPG